MVQPVSRSAEEVNRLECLISARIQPFLLVWARQEAAFIHIKEVPDLIVPFRSPSPSSKHRVKTGAGQDAGDGLALVALNLDPPFLHCAPGAARLLHFLGEGLFLNQTDTEET